MVSRKDSLDSIPEFYPSAEDSLAQTVKPSVTWSSPVSYATAAPASDNPSSVPASAFVRRDSQSSRQDVCLGVQPQICFPRPRQEQPPVLFSLMNSSEAAATKFLPKSHLSRVIIRDNVSAQRLFEKETKSSDKTRKKMSHLYDHLKRKFITDQVRKLRRWKQESLSLRRHLGNTQLHGVQFKLEPLEKPV